MNGLADRIALGTKSVESQVAFFEDRFGSVESEWKKDNSRVTEADYRISERVCNAVSETFPKDDFCSEESGQKETQYLDAQFCWVIDPVDGTNNFAIGLPNCAISLALLENGDPIYGWVYDFAGKRLIHGGAGRGLFSGHDPLTPRKIGRETDTPIGIQFPLPSSQINNLQSLFSKERIRSFGSGTMIGTYVCLGLLEGAIDFRVKVWDIAAFVALFKETGLTYQFIGKSPFPLRTFDLEMDPTPYVAGTTAFHDRMRKKVPTYPEFE